MFYRIRWCQEKDFDNVLKLNKQSNIFATAQFLTGPSSIKKTMNSNRYIFLVAEHTEDGAVGYILSQMKTSGVCFNLLLAVEKEHRRKGIGGALIIAMLKLLKIPDTKFNSFKWYAEVPAYNVEALQMYKALQFPVEGLMRKQTRAKTDMYLLAFYLDEKEIPEYGKHVHNPVEIVDNGIVGEFMERFPKLTPALVEDTKTTSLEAFQ